MRRTGEPLSRYETRDRGFLSRIGIVSSIASIASMRAALGKRAGSDWGSQSPAGRLRRTADTSNSQAVGPREAYSGSFYRLRMIHPQPAGDRQLPSELRRGRHEVGSS